MTLPEGYEKGFHDEDGTLKEYLEWGYEIGFVFNEKEYRIDRGYYGGRDIIDCETEKHVLHVESENVDDFLESKFDGGIVREILENEAYITELH